MDTQLRRSGLEDEPTAMGVDKRPLENVAEEGARRFGIVRIHNSVDGCDQALGT
jgi:hypothetical protein